MIAMLLMALPLFGESPEMSVLVGGTPRPEYHHRGTTYIEALRGRDFTIRLTNPTPHRVAVALSVDGLNTIDARHSDAWSAAKWVLEPYESTEISGWQVNNRTARRFFFTGERNSYGAALGQTQNLGIIEAVFYRERPPRYSERRREYSRDQRGGAEKQQDAESRAAPRAAAESAPPSDDYAATGMGGRTRHEVQEIDMALERDPFWSIALRYEFRPQLVKLGVMFDRGRDPLERRERAQGFCPEPY
jgi:hypothetical protein